MTDPALRLTADAVSLIFRDCLFRDGEDITDHVAAEGLTGSVGFHPGRLADHRSDIARLLGELPDEFRTGGWSFLNACVDRHGDQWGEQRNVQELLLLGLATGQAAYCMPREMWPVLPGGVPYFEVKPDAVVS